MCMQNLFIYSFIVDDVIIFCYDVIYPFLCVGKGKNLFQHEIFGRAKISFLDYPCQNVRSLVEKKIIRTFIFQKISNLLMSYFRYCIKPKVFSTSTQDEFITLHPKRQYMAEIYIISHQEEYGLNCVVKQFLVNRDVTIQSYDVTINMVKMEKL